MAPRLAISRYTTATENVGEPFAVPSYGEIVSARPRAKRLATVLLIQSAFAKNPSCDDQRRKRQITDVFSAPEDIPIV